MRWVVHNLKFQGSVRAGERTHLGGSLAIGDHLPLSSSTLTSLKIQSLIGLVMYPSLRTAQSPGVGKGQLQKEEVKTD